MLRDGLILAIEISNPSADPDSSAGVALGRATAGSVQFLGEEPLRAGVRHDDDLMPAIDRLFAAHRASPRDLASIAVSAGPGGYTSLRIAVATAKMLAFATGADTIPIPSALVAAHRVTPDRAPAVVCLASKGETAHATLLPPADDAWWRSTGRAAVPALAGPEAADAADRALAAGRSWTRAAIPLGVIAADELAAFRPATIIADRFLPASFRAAAERLSASILEPAFSPRALLELAPDHAPVDPLALAPIYAREAEAVTQWRRRKAGP